MRSYITEFIGTFFLVFAIGLSVIGLSAKSGADVWAPLAIGSMLMVMVFMGGHISGAHYNPAVSLAVLLRGKMKPADFVPYVVAQVAGSALAAVLVRYVILKKGVESKPFTGEQIPSALLLEFIFTFALALVVLNVATAKGTSGNSFYGLAIGFTVVAGAICDGGISRSAFNPAVGIGITMLGVPAQDIWIYMVGPFAGGAAAAAVFKVQNPEG